MRCECLFCENEAVARFTAPRLKPRFLICEADLEKQLAWAEPYRRIPGQVRVERISQ
jgi:hypothetical protein